MEHRAIRQGDEFYCPICSTRWGVDEQPPGDCVKMIERNTPPPTLKKRVRPGNIGPAHWAYLRKVMEDGDKKR